MYQHHSKLKTSWNPWIRGYHELNITRSNIWYGDFIGGENTTGQIPIAQIYSGYYLQKLKWSRA